MFSISCPHCQAEQSIEKEPDQALEINCESCKKQFAYQVETLVPCLDISEDQNPEDAAPTETIGSQPSEPMKKEPKARRKHRNLLWILIGGVLGAIFVSNLPNIVPLYGLFYQPRTIYKEKAKPTVTQNGISIKPLSRISLLSALDNDGASDALSYQWLDSYFRYDIKSASESTEFNLDSVGYVNYKSNSKQDFSIVEELAEFEKEGSATGFVVHPEGIIITCAHVILGAKSVNVELDGTDYEAKIIFYNPTYDLAVLKIQAEGLTFIPIAEANQIEVAEEVRVIGYPLSDTVDETLNTTPGSVSGIVTAEEIQKLQLDSIVNAGNNGGPVIDNQGRVLGVASTLLNEEKISDVGFAVPAEEISKMLTEMDIPTAQSNSEEKLPAPELAKRIKPAIVTIKIQTGAGGFGFAPNIVNYHSSIDTIGAKREQYSETSRMLVNAYGNIHLHKGQAGLPYRLGSIGKIGIEQLSQDGALEWETEEHTLISEAEVTTQAFVVHPGLFISDLKKKVTAPDALKTYHPAIIRTSYKIASDLDGIATVEKKYSLRTIEKNSESNPYLEITGQGSFDFNKTIGLPTSSTMHYEITQYNQSNNRYVTIPVTLNYAYLEYGEELKFMIAMNNGTARDYVKKADR